MPNSSPRTQGKRPADFTGLQSERLQQSKAAEQQDAATRMALLTAQQKIESETLVDYTGSGEPLPEAVVKKAEVSSPYRTIRVNSKIEDMTYGREVLDPGDLDADPPRPPIMGAITRYTFEEGRPYRVTREMADHLNRLGYLSYQGA